MKSEIKILKLMLQNRENKFTIRQLSKSAKINYRIAHEKVTKLEKEGLIKTTKIGNSRICELANAFNHKIFEAEYQRRQDFLKNKNMLILCNRLQELKFGFIALLFGSYAKGTADKDSDIDILTIGGMEKEIRLALSLLPEKMHLTHVTYQEFIQMAKSREFTVVSEAMKCNVLLAGIEEYYRLLKNAR
ncbi:MAG: nucleotidyltransferase domain-containing protein [Candidatus Woesearchaeota archaeon]